MALMFHVTVERTICTAHGGDRGLHGHNWAVRATLSATTLDEHGHVVAPRALEALLWEVVEPLDHRRLEDLSEFTVAGPCTATALAAWVGRALQSRYVDGRVRVTRVAVADGTSVTSSWTPERGLVADSTSEAR